MTALESEEYIGFCIGCGAEQGQCEPDTRERICEACGVPAVFGAEELMIQLALTNQIEPRSFTNP